LGQASGVRSGVFDLSPKDENRETEVSGFRFFALGTDFPSLRFMNFNITISHLMHRFRKFCVLLHSIIEKKRFF
jgi:hypothetical protein